MILRYLSMLDPTTSLMGKDFTIPLLLPHVK
jgi:hypothetical protein